MISPEETFARVWRFTGARIMRTDWTACEAPKRKRPCRIQIARSAPHQSRIGARWSRVLIHCGLARFPALLQWCTHQTPLSKLELLAGSLFSQTLRAWWGRVNKPNVTRTPPTSSSVPVRPQSEQGVTSNIGTAAARGRQRVCGSGCGRSRATDMIVSRKLALRQAHSINEMVPIYRRLLLPNR